MAKAASLLVCALAALAFAFAFAGCGSSEPSLSAFKSGFQAQKMQFTRLGHDLTMALQRAPRESNSQIETSFLALSHRTSQRADQLQKLRAPSKYKSQLAQLVRGFRTVAVDLGSISSDARLGRASDTTGLVSKLVRDAGNVRSADRSLTASLGLPQTS